MNRVDEVFERLRAERRTGLAPFVCAGSPSLEATTALLPALSEAGASVIEVGIPFSDPIADGPVIAAAMHEALARGVTLEGSLGAVAAAREKTSCAVVAMASVSIAARVGVGGFTGRLAAAGFDGVIFPDAPLEEAGPLLQAAREAGLTASLLVAPTTPQERAERIAQACSGFVYMLARTGITGEQEDAPDVGERVGALRRATGAPILCGFGISTAAQVRAVTAHADGAIVGSALVRRAREAAGLGEDPVEAVARLVRELCAGLEGR